MAACNKRRITAGKAAAPEDILATAHFPDRSLLLALNRYDRQDLRRFLYCLY